MSTSLHRGPIGTHGGRVEASSPGTLIVEGGLWKQSISLYGHSERGPWRRAPLLGTLKVV